MSADALFSAGNVASFRMQVSRTTRKIGPGAAQRPCAALGFDERNRLGFGHGFAAALAVRSCQCRRQLEPDHLATNDGRRIHDTSVCEGGERLKRSSACIASGSHVVCPDEIRQHRVRFLAARQPAI